MLMNASVAEEAGGVVVLPNAGPRNVTMKNRAALMVEIKVFASAALRPRCRLSSKNSGARRRGNPKPERPKPSHCRVAPRWKWCGVRGEHS